LLPGDLSNAPYPHFWTGYRGAVYSGLSVAPWRSGRANLPGASCVGWSTRG